MKGQFYESEDSSYNNNSIKRKKIIVKHQVESI